jgi:hypothetical protein
MLSAERDPFFSHVANREERLRPVYVFVMNNRKEGKRAAYASKTTLVGHPRSDLAAGHQRMRHEQAIRNTIAHGQCPLYGYVGHLHPLLPKR